VRPTQFPVRWVHGALSSKDKAAEAGDGVKLTIYVQCRGEECLDPHFHFALRLHTWCLIKYKDSLTEQLRVYADCLNNYLLLRGSHVKYRVQNGSPSNPNLSQFTSLMCGCMSPSSVLILHTDPGVISQVVSFLMIFCISLWDLKLSLRLQCGV
jgi:hypothetical protein